MKERYQQAFADRFGEFAAARIPQPTPRGVRLLELPGKADVVVGMRRVGKSWLLLHRIHELLAAGVPRQRILYCDFEDERLAGLQTEHLQLLDDAFFARYPDSRSKECWFFFDEVQQAPGWEKYVRRLLADRRLHLTVTGSSARLLSTEIATSLRGRALTTELLPFSFAEYVAHLGIAMPDLWPVAGEERSHLQHAFARYQASGGFPEVLSFDDEAWRRTLQSYLEIALLRDVAERHAISNLPALRFVVRRLLRSIANRTSVNALVHDLKSQGIGIGKDQVYSFLAHLVDSYLVFLLPLHATSERRRQMNPRKVYAIDHGLVRACAISMAADVGYHLENMVYLELRRRGEVLGYHLTEAGREVDFVAADHAGVRQLVQACADLAAETTRERELRALVEAVQETGIDAATVVSIGEEGTETIDGIPIRIVPAWRWLLEQPRGKS